MVSAIAFFWRVLSVREPIVDIRTFTDRNFGVGCLISFCVGIGLYGLTYMYPRYLAEVRGYSPLMIGETMFALRLLEAQCIEVRLEGASEPTSGAQGASATPARVLVMSSTSCWRRRGTARR